MDSVFTQQVRHIHTSAEQVSQVIPCQAKHTGSSVTRINAAGVCGGMCGVCGGVGVFVGFVGVYGGVGVFVGRVGLWV